MYVSGFLVRSSREAPLRFKAYRLEAAHGHKHIHTHIHPRPDKSSTLLGDVLLLLALAGASSWRKCHSRVVPPKLKPELELVGPAELVSPGLEGPQQRRAAGKPAGRAQDD